MEEPSMNWGDYVVLLVFSFSLSSWVILPATSQNEKCFIHRSDSGYDFVLINTPWSTSSTSLEVWKETCHERNMYSRSSLTTDSKHANCLVVVLKHYLQYFLGITNPFKCINTKMLIVKNCIFLWLGSCRWSIQSAIEKNGCTYTLYLCKCQCFIASVFTHACM